MWHAENILGLKAVTERIRAYETQHGPRWRIAPLLERLAAGKGSWST
jgi:hypothetical protein